MTSKPQVKEDGEMVPRTGEVAAVPPLQEILSLPSLVTVKLAVAVRDCPK